MKSTIFLKCSAQHRNSVISKLQIYGASPKSYFYQTFHYYIHNIKYFQLTNHLQNTKSRQMIYYINTFYYQSYIIINLFLCMTYSKLCSFIISFLYISYPDDGFLTGILFLCMIYSKLCLCITSFHSGSFFNIYVCLYINV